MLKWEQILSASAYEGGKKTSEDLPIRALKVKILQKGTFPLDPATY